MIYIYIFSFHLYIYNLKPKGFFFDWTRQDLWIFNLRGNRTKEMLQCVERTSTERSGNGESYTVYHYDRPFAFWKKQRGVQIGGLEKTWKPIVYPT